MGRKNATVCHRRLRNPVTLGVIKEAASRTTDKSREALISIFGEVVNDPLAITGGTGDTVLASIFKVTNGAMLVIGAIFVCYILFNRLANTAHDGAVFDRDKMTLWEPIRVVWGLATLVPTVNGWSLAQLLMLWAAAIIGVGTANLGVDAALAAFEDGKSMVAHTPMPSTLDPARELFKANLCKDAVNKALDMGVDAATLNPQPEDYMRQDRLYDNTAFSYGFALKNASFTCGTASVGWGGVQNVKHYVFYTDIDIDPAPIHEAHSQALQNMQNYFAAASQQFVNDVVARKHDNTLPLADANKIIRNAANQYEITVSKIARSIEDNELPNLAKKISDSIKDGGWWMLGSWYQTFAQANAKMAEAINGRLRVSGISASGDIGMEHLYIDVMQAFDPQIQNALNGSDNSSAGGNNGTGGAQNTASAHRAVAPKASPADTSQATSDVFGGLGQEILNGIISYDKDTNPIIRAKDFGDRLMVIGEAGIAATAAANAGLAGKALAVTAAAVVGSPAAAAKVAIMMGVVEAIGPMVYVLVLALFFFGATLAIYVPLAPFIVWFGGIINWLVVVGEAVVAAPLWAMIHLAGEGDGFGHKTSHGYIFLLNCMVRPILMVIGFFLGGAIVIVGGKVLNELFMIAIANSQYDSITGFFSIIGFVAIYCFLILNLIHSCFNLIFIVPDQVINWVGGHASPALGRDVSDKSRMAAAAMVATGQGALGRIGKAGTQGGLQDRFKGALAAAQKKRDDSSGFRKG